MLRDGDHLGLRWKSDERAAAPSYASGPATLPAGPRCLSRQARRAATQAGFAVLVFFGCLSANNRLSEQLQDRDTTTALVFSTEPLADLLDLAGFAIIFSELHGKGYWAVVKTMWDEYFSKHPKPSAVLEFLTSVVGNRQQLFFGI